MSNARNLANTIGNGVINSDGYIDVADDLTSTYAVSGIAGLSTISVAAAAS